MLFYSAYINKRRVLWLPEDLENTALQDTGKSNKQLKAEISCHWQTLLPSQMDRGTMLGCFPLGIHQTDNLLPHLHRLNSKVFGS